LKNHFQSGLYPSLLQYYETNEAEPLPAKRQKKKHGEEHLQSIINLCKSIEDKGIDPFLVEIDDVIGIIQEYFPEWKSIEEINLDAEAINRLASVIKLQSDWVRHRSTSLYTDPFLLEEKIRTLSKEELTDFFLRAWHPIIELEQISPYSLANAVEYWKSLLPLDERWLKTKAVETELGATSRRRGWQNPLLGLCRQEFLRGDLATSLHDKFSCYLRLCHLRCVSPRGRGVH